MTKQRRTVSLDPETEEHLSQSGVNASELVNRLVKSHMTMGGDRQSMLELRAEQLRSDVSELEGRLETKRQELELVESKLDEYRDERADVLDEAAEKLSDTTLDPTNPAIEKWAERAGMQPETFIDELEARR